MWQLRITFSVLGLSGLLAGCAVERTTVIDRNSDVVRLGKGVRGEVYVWRDGAWRPAGKVTLPEGWWAGPGPKTMP